MTLDGKPVPRWRVPHPAAGAPTTFDLDDLPPSSRFEIEVAAVAASGKVSAAAKVAVESSPALPAPPALGELHRPAGGRVPRPTTAGCGPGRCPAAVKVSPEKPEAMAGEMDGDCRGVQRRLGRQVRPPVRSRGEYVALPALP